MEGELKKKVYSTTILLDKKITTMIRSISIEYHSVLHLLQTRNDLTESPRSHSAGLVTQHVENTRMNPKCSNLAELLPLRVFDRLQLPNPTQHLSLLSNLLFQSLHLFLLLLN